MRPKRHRASQTLVGAVLLGVLQVGISSPACAKDLTKLSLEELGHLDVIQVTIPGAHYHFQGDYMIGYQDTSMQYGGYLTGNQTVNNQQVTSQFMMAETNMTENMQSLMFMYGIRDNWTFNLEVPYLNISSTQETFSSDIRGSNSVSGLGDVNVSIIHPFKYKYPIQFQGELGLGLPTGGIDNFALMPGMFGPQKLPYSMQLGSGSFTFQPSFTMLGETAKLAFGAQVKGYVPLNTNWDNYVVPDKLSATAWAAPYVNKHFSPSVRVDYVTQGNVRGNDPNMDFSIMPSSDPLYQAGSRADVYFGVNFSFDQDGEGHGRWLSLEAGFPFYQSLTGPQLRLNSVYSGALEWTFK